MQVTRTIIVEDDNASKNLLKLIIEEHFHNIEIVAFAENVQDAVDLVNNEKPELIFLDIELPDGYGFEVIQKAEFKNFEVIFVSAFNKYALRAFDFAALHYLIKPITCESLKIALERYKHKANFKLMEKRLQVLKSNLSNEILKIMLPTGNGMEFFNLDEIIRCEADDNYTIVYLTGNKKYIMVTKTLSTLDAALSESGFVRIHRKYLINFKYIKKFIKSKKNPSVVMIDGAELPISESRYDEFVELIEQNVKLI